jgi:hypothetical protein
METYNFETGDLLLFDGKSEFSFFGFFARLIKFFTKSDYSHIGMIVKNPSFANLPDGLYLWHSSLEENDAEDHKTKLGVQFTPLERIIKNYHGKLFWRKLNPGNVRITNQKLKEIHNLVHDKPYDLNFIDWFDALIEHSTNRRTSRFFCSALVARIYSFLNLIDSNMDWSIIRPSSFSQENLKDPTHIFFINEAYLYPEVQINSSGDYRTTSFDS